MLAAYNIGLLTRYTRSAVLEVINDDYVRAARSKGMPTGRPPAPHPARRNALDRHGRRALVRQRHDGTVLVETIFSWPGIGQYAYHSATTLDLPAIMGVSLFVAIVYITINFIVDVLYGVIDPRMRVQ